MSTARTKTPLEMLEDEAREILSRPVFDYVAGGAGTEWGLQNNLDAFRQYSIVSTRLQKVASIDTSVELLGQRIETPIIFAPTAFHRLACKEGELATVRAAEKCGAIMTLSTMSSTSLEAVASAAKNAKKWFQLYVFKNRSLTESLVRRAEEAGYGAIVVTIDVPAMGMRYRDIVNKFALPEDIEAANLRSAQLSSMSGQTEGSKIKELTDAQFDDDLTWDSIDWLASLTKLPIIVKGILSAEDAAEALKHKVSAIIVSNHGGRQLDSEESPLHVLPDIVDVVQDNIPVLMDGGIRSGDDVLKALALGAKAVLIGRPVIWGLAVGGEDHLVKSIQALQAELKLAMKISGCASLEKIHERGLSMLSGERLILRRIMKQLENRHNKNEVDAIPTTTQSLVARFGVMGK